MAPIRRPALLPHHMSLARFDGSKRRHMGTREGYRVKYRTRVARGRGLLFR
jgi:hypothetical protein